MGTPLGLILRDQSGKFSSLSGHPGNPSILLTVVSDLIEDHTGAIWVGSFDGLHKVLENDKLAHFRIEKGPQFEQVHALIEDNRHFIWLRMSRGLARFDPLSETFKLFAQADGLQGNLYNSGAFIRARTGEIFFGGFNGFTIIDSDLIVDKPFIPPIAITDFKLFNESVALSHDDPESPLHQPIHMTRELSLSWRQNVFSFDFTILDFSNPTLHTFAYRLDHFDRDWNTTERRFASYTNLQPGAYVFRVKAANENHVWNETSIKLNIEPPPWRTWWAYALYAFFVFAVCYGYYRYVMSKVVAARDRLTREQAAHRDGMADISARVLHTLGNALNSMKVSSDLTNEVLLDREIRLMDRIVETLRGPSSDHGFMARLPDALTQVSTHIKRSWGRLKDENHSIKQQIEEMLRFLDRQRGYVDAPILYNDIVLDDLVVDILAGMNGELKRGEILVARDLQAKLLVYIPCNLLTEVINLLLHDGITALLGVTWDRGLSIETRMVSPGTLSIRITDNGPPLTVEQLETVFQQGAQAGGRSEDLHYCANSINRMNGTIQAASGKGGKGLSFTLVLPLGPTRAGNQMDPPDEVLVSRKP